MAKIPFIKQHDSMQCGAACLFMVCRHYGMNISLDEIDALCVPTKEGMSMLGLKESAQRLGFECSALKAPPDIFSQLQLPCLLHWEQKHFVVLYELGKKSKKFKVADPGKGLISYSKKEFEDHWISSEHKGTPCGIVMELTPTECFYKHMAEYAPEERSFRFLFRYIRQYRKYFVQIILGLLLGCLLQLIMPFLTQAIVDVGIKHNDIGFIRLVLLGELMIVAGRTATDFIRRWLLLHISMRINISLVSDFFMKLLKLPMSFFDTKLMGDLLQRIGDHSRVQNFLTGQVLNVVFTFLSFIIFGIVLFIYDKIIFCVFVAGSMIYGLWISSFLRRRKVLDYELFELQAINQNKTYQFITSMQEIKLQDCERRRRWEWEDTQAAKIANIHGYVMGLPLLKREAHTTIWSRTSLNSEAE